MARTSTSERVITSASKALDIWRHRFLWMSDSPEMGLSRKLNHTVKATDITQRWVYLRGGAG